MHISKAIQNQTYPRLKLQPEFAENEGSSSPCGWCLSTDGKCKLSVTINSTKRYTPLSSSCAKGKFRKLSIKAIDQRTTKSENPSRNRVVMCPELGCQTPFWRINAKRHYSIWNVMQKLLGMTFP